MPASAPAPAATTTPASEPAHALFGTSSRVESVADALAAIPRVGDEPPAPEPAPPPTATERDTEFDEPPPPSPDQVLAEYMHSQGHVQPAPEPAAARSVDARIDATIDAAIEAEDDADAASDMAAVRSNPLRDLLATVTSSKRNIAIAAGGAGLLVIVMALAFCGGGAKPHTQVAASKPAPATARTPDLAPAAAAQPTAEPAAAPTGDTAPGETPPTDTGAAASGSANPTPPAPGDTAPTTPAADPEPASEPAPPAPDDTTSKPAPTKSTTKSPTKAPAVTNTKVTTTPAPKTATKADAKTTSKTPAKTDTKSGSRTTARSPATKAKPGDRKAKPVQVAAATSKASGPSLGGKPVVLEYDTQARDNKPTPGSPSSEQKAISKARVSYAAGNQKLFAGDAASAILYYKQALAAYPGYVAGYRGLGLAYAKQGDKTKAVQALKTYLGAAPGAKDAPLLKKRIETLQKK